MPLAERQSMRVGADGSKRPRSDVDGRWVDLTGEIDLAFDRWLVSLETSLRTSVKLSSQQVAADRPIEINFEGELIVSGFLVATMQSRAGTLIVTSRGILCGNISVKNAIIHGMLQGEIAATGSVELTSSAQVIGDIETNALEIQPGAIFEGRCSFFGDSRARPKGANNLQSSLRSLPREAAESFAPELLAAAG